MTDVRQDEVPTLGSGRASESSRISKSAPTIGSRVVVDLIRSGGVASPTNCKQGGTMAEEKVVWVSRAMMDSTLIKPFLSDLYFADKELAIDAIRRTKRGEALPADLYPKEHYGKYPDKQMGRQPDIFSAGGVWLVSAAFAEILRRIQSGTHRPLSDAALSTQSEDPSRG